MFRYLLMTPDRMLLPFLEDQSTHTAMPSCSLIHPQEKSLCPMDKILHQTVFSHFPSGKDFQYVLFKKRSILLNFALPLF